MITIARVKDCAATIGAYAFIISIAGMPVAAAATYFIPPPPPTAAQQECKRIGMERALYILSTERTATGSDLYTGKETTIYLDVQKTAAQLDTIARYDDKERAACSQ